jgi:copper chaperone NosL
MKRTSRIVVAIAALSLATLFVAPMWRVDLKAPQYPEGLGLRIWINQIRGATPNGLNSINGLNHYIGMKAIEPDQIPELRFMPYVVIGLILCGLLVAGLGKRGLLYTYLGVFFAIAMAGLYDFWRWEYDYGHNLDPTAAIRITGMSYQPPLIGGKQLLNFHATSWPDVGGWAAIVAVSLVVVAALIEWRAGRSASRPQPAAAAARGLAGGMLA